MYRTICVIALMVQFSTATPTLFGSSTKESALDLIILHNNDMHARFEQTSQYSTQCHPEEVLANRCYGGFARVSSELKKFRKQAEKGGPSVLYLNAGDTYTGTPWFAMYKDEIVTSFMNLLKPDAISLGNHELDLGIEGLIPFLNGADFPVLISNLANSPNHDVWQTKALKKSVIFDLKGHKVGVIGYLTPETKLVAAPNDLEFMPEVDGINKEAEVLKNKGVNIIIALGHSGYIVDKEIAEKCPDVDVVIGGHSNTFLYNGEQPDLEAIEGPYPTVIKQESGKEVPVVQAYAYTKYLGKLELSFDNDGNLLHWGGHPILLNSDIPRDPDVLTLLEKYRPQVYSLTQEIVCTTKVHLEGSNCRAEECNLGNLVADAMIYTRVLQYNGTRWTDASIAFIQGGGIRSSATVGKVSKFDLTTMLPFNNTLVKLKVNGGIIMQALEHSVQRYTGDLGEFLQMAGCHVVYNMSKPAGHRVVSANVMCSDCEVPMYKPLVPEQEYGLIVSSFLQNGGDNFTMFQGVEAEDMGISEFDAVLHYMHDLNTVYPAVEGRVVMLPSNASILSISFSLFIAVVLLNYFQ